MNVLINFLKHNRSLILVSILCLFVANANAQQTTGLQASIITEISANKADFPIVDTNRSIATIRYDSSNYTGVIHAIGDLQNDIGSVTGIKPQLITTGAYTGFEIIVGTLGQSKLIDQLVKAKKNDVTDLKGKWESFVIVTIPNSNSITKNSLDYE